MESNRAMMARQAWAALETAHCLYTGEQVAAALDVLAARLEAAVGQLNPLIMVVLNGAVVFAGQLLPRLAFPLEVDYVHATRYAGALTGGALSWVAGPSQPVEGRTVVLLDDILDEGHTLAAAASKLRESGAARVLKAVLVTKDRPRGPGLEADFSALDVPDRYIFGWGMDYEGFLRNAKGIYVLP